jgi:hypothetical protein
VAVFPLPSADIGSCNLSEQPIWLLGTCHHVRLLGEPEHTAERLRRLGFSCPGAATTHSQYGRVVAGEQQPEPPPPSGAVASRFSLGIGAHLPPPVCLLPAVGCC